MTVQELIEQLQSLPGDLELRVAYQPNYPIAAYFDGVAVELEEPVGDEELNVISPDELVYYENSAPRRAYLVAGYSPHDEPYAPRDCWNVA